MKRLFITINKETIYEDYKQVNYDAYMHSNKQVIKIEVID